MIEPLFHNLSKDENTIKKTVFRTNQAGKQVLPKAVDFSKKDNEK